MLAMNALVDIRDLSVSYDGTPALCSVDLTIYEHDFLGVIGPNGGGKTTLVKSILGMVTYSGTIRYTGESTKEKIGYLPQQRNFDVDFPISVNELILSGLQSQKGLIRRYTTRDRQHAAKLMQLCGIEDVARSAVGRISGGQLQRALLCRAMISQPRLLILDEPANFVDNHFERQLYAILREANERMAIVMVSHDLSAIGQVAKRIVHVERHLQEVENR